MNHLPVTPAASVIPAMDQPVWSEFDIFDLHTLSSPASWVSGTEPSSPSPIIPALETEQIIATSRDPDSFPDYPDHLASPSPIPEQLPSHPPNLPSNLTRNHLPLAPPYPKLPVSASDLPDADDIVDTALDFPSPASPVLSDLPISPFDQPDLPPPSVTPIQSPFIPVHFPSHSLVDQTLLPHPSQHLLLPSALLAVQSSRADDSCSSKGSPSSSNQRRALPQSKKTSLSIDTRLARRAPRTKGHKQARRYSAPKSSRYCHLCARHERCVQMIPCGNVELGLCQKSICKKCISTYNLEVTGPSWPCPHCQSKCPQRAKCFAYDRQTARRREKTLKAKMFGISPAVARGKTAPSPK